MFSLPIMNADELEALVDALEARLAQDNGTILANVTIVRLRRLYDRARALQAQDSKRRVQRG